MDKLEKLKELKQLLNEGLIDDQEYSKLKKELLDGNIQEVTKLQPKQEKEESYSGKSYCPNCGSSDIQLRKNSNVNWGRAVAGWALFGIVGGAVGAVTGDDKHSNVCINCGTSWNASDLYKSLQICESLIEIKLDLRFEEDRMLLEEFISDIGTHLQGISDAENQTKKIIEEKEKDENQFAAGGCGLGLVFGIAGCSGLLSFNESVAIISFLFCVITGTIIGSLMDVLAKQGFKRELEAVKSERARVERQLKESLQEKIEDFIFYHQLDR